MLSRHLNCTCTLFVIQNTLLQVPHSAWQQKIFFKRWHRVLCTHSRFHCLQKSGCWQRVRVEHTLSSSAPAEWVNAHLSVGLEQVKTLNVTQAATKALSRPHKPLWRAPYLLTSKMCLKLTVFIPSKLARCSPQSLRPQNMFVYMFVRNSEWVHA